MESQPQNPVFRNNPENFHPWKYEKVMRTVYLLVRYELLDNKTCL